MRWFYRRNLPHIEAYCATYFVTFSTKGDLFLPYRARSIALKHCLFESKKRIELHAAVIMPTHVHLLFTPLENDQGEPFSLAEIMKGIKGSSAYNINKLLGRKGALWLPESFDRIMRRGDFEHKLDYIRANPDEYRWLWLSSAQTRVSVPHGLK
jgi:REP element-mobilizing transposase RayT